MLKIDFILCRLCEPLYLEMIDFKLKVVSVVAGKKPMFIHIKEIVIDLAAKLSCCGSYSILQL